MSSAHTRLYPTSHNSTYTVVAATTLQHCCVPPTTCVHHRPNVHAAPTTHTVGECECCVCDTTTHWGVWVRLLCSATRRVHTAPPHRELVSVCVVVVALPHIGVECECSVCTDMPTSAVCPPTFSSPPNRQVHISQVAAAVASAEACHGPHSSLCKLPLRVGGRGAKGCKTQTILARHFRLVDAHGLTAPGRVAPSLTPSVVCLHQGAFLAWCQGATTHSLRDGGTVDGERDQHCVALGGGSGWLP